MSVGHPKVEPIMAKLNKHIKGGAEHYNPVYEAFWDLIIKQEELEQQIRTLSPKTN